MIGYLRLLALYIRLGALGELQYRANFVIQLIDSLVKTGIALVGIAVVFSHTQTLGGWSRMELQALLGVFLLVGGMINMVLEPSMIQLMDDVRKGTLDYVILKPEDTQLLVSARQVEIWKFIDIVLGLGILGYSLWQLSEPVGLQRAALFGATLLSGGALIYSFWLMLATCSFWFVKITNILNIFESMYEAGKWPVGLYPSWLRNTLTFIVPVAVAVSIPAEALLGRLNVQTALIAALCGGTGLVLSRWFWTVGLRHYSGASA